MTILLHNESGLNSMKNLDVKVKVLNFFPSPLAVFKNEFLEADAKFFLESSVIRPEFSRFSFMGDAGGPLGETITYEVNTKTLNIERKGQKQHLQLSNIFDYLQNQLKQRKVTCPDELPFDFNLGYVGMFGYEIKAETIGTGTYKSASHDAAFIFASRMIVFDHLEQRCFLLHLVIDKQTLEEADSWFTAVEQRMLAVGKEQDLPAKLLPTRMSLPDVEQWIAENTSIRHSKQLYIDKIHQALKEIIDGESYEVCLTNLIEFPYEESPFDLYCVMRQLTPAPHAGFFSIGDFHLVSSSPERFLSVNKSKQAEAKPIKGTRPRGCTPDEDIKQIEELKGNKKDRAENLMIVDLLRNDLGQSCSIQSIHVPKLFDIETYSHVHQMVSTICGHLRPDVSTMECVRNVFPGGSMTGAPKKRTMEIIDRLEQGARGIYSGALGWFGLSEACDLNIVIRSVVIDRGVATFGVGGALTALSDPEDEFVETMVKARGIVEAVCSVRGETI
ncbi:aminodeoxychorismate synthase component I [Xenorhabdus bovienii]|uniref:aminodeoxychorismate synthase component I n=1 Tax=Xenorhabdus bovienii TaxID=40576 RepID=UPI0023B2575E|nr:aminodeoxychorismate synthase component I [Xenorhabdus bovienii]MDE9535029.1 aminodeoxychorismate synthase component I [Xenorhabdus bovienii]MDE9587715.1 aminodeoxychorismate synthase component I [Xenorhabdus bovienii]